MGRSGVITLVVLALVIIAGFLYLSQVKEGNKQEALETSQAGSALSQKVSYTDANGNSIELSQYLGETIVAVVWASWCPDCVEQLKLLTSLSENYEDIKIVAFNRGEPESTVKDFLSYYKLDSSLYVVLDTDDHFFSSVDGQVMPETIIFDSAGEIGVHHRGLVSETELRESIDEIQNKFAED